MTKEKMRKLINRELDRRQFLKGMAKTAGGLALASTVGFGYRGTARASEAKYGGTLKWACPEYPKSFDPAMATLWAEIPMTRLAYNHLVSVDRNLNPIPELAKSWNSNDNGKTWIIKLRDDVKWHNGRKFDVEDVIYTMERWMDPSTVASSVVSGKQFESVTAIDKYTVKLVLKTPYADQPFLFTKYQCPILPHFNPTFEKVIGTGPFILEEAIPGEKLVYVKNKEYWEKGLPYLDKFHQVVMPDLSSQMVSLMSGELDVAFQCPYEWVPKLRKREDIYVIEIEAGSYSDIRMRVDRKPFNDNRVRLAFKYCLDREAFAKAALQGFGVPGNDIPMSPLNPYYNKSIPLRQQDYKKAKKLLAQAGYPNGLKVTIYTSTARIGQLEAGITLKEQCKPAGIEIDVKNIEPGKFWAEYWKDADLNIGNWVVRVTPEGIFRKLFYTGEAWNYSRYSNPELDELLDKGRIEMDEKKKRNIYDKVQQIIYDEGSFLVPTFKNVYSGVRKGVHYPVDMAPTNITFEWAALAWKE